MIEFGREVCGFLPASERREWLVTNGIGGCAAGTVSGLNTRRYHGLLIAALQPPLGRTLLLTKLDETADYDGHNYDLFTNRWQGNAVNPNGYQHIESFRLEGTTPVWTFAIADALLEKRVWMAREANTTYIHYALRRASQPVTLHLKALVNYRDFHASTHAGNWQMQIEPVALGLKVSAFDGATTFYILSDKARAIPAHEWYRNYFLSLEAERGLDPLDDNLYAGQFTVTLNAGESCALVASTDAAPNLDGTAVYQAQHAYEQQLLEIAGAVDDATQQLVLAADQFVVRRGAGHSVIAGYPWFGDWGRDTMISLAGLTISTRRYEIAASILRTFAQFVDRGMLPNRFPDAHETPEYNTVDATLWYFEALHTYFEAANDINLIRDLFPVLQSIIDCHIKGTRYNIHVDPSDGLLHSGEAGVQLTWMDAKIGEWVVTPRTGKAVEINALWYNALHSMADFAAALGENPGYYREVAEHVRESFARFWNEAAGYCYDVIDTPNGDDASLRPNQLFAVSLKHSPLNPEQQRAVVAACSRHLLTSHGLRSLSPTHLDYKGLYRGDSFARDSVYHQGTVWAWLIGAFVEAHLRVHQNKTAARAFLLPLLQQMQEYSLGSLSEIFDGDVPHTPRGCFAQAWSIAEVLRVWKMLA
jgi:predicted glycogen debranching enzyme